MLPNWARPFLDAYALCGVTVDAASAAGISTSAVYALKDRDADFAAAFELAKEDYADAVVREIARRGMHGVDEPVVYQGQLTAVWERDATGAIVTRTIKAEGQPDTTEPVQARNPDGSLKWLAVRKYSDALLALHAKAVRKAYGTDRTEITGAGGGPLEAVDATARAARVAHLMALAQQRKAEQDAGSEFA